MLSTGQSSTGGVVVDENCRHLVIVSQIDKINKKIAIFVPEVDTRGTVRTDRSCLE